MSFFDSLKSVFAKAQADFQRDERWVMAEINRGWVLLHSVGHTIDVDIRAIFGWISTHHTSIIATLNQALKEAAVIGAIVPGAAPAVTAATLAIDAATAAIDALSKTVVAGSTPLATAVNAYHAVKDAQTAVNAVIKQATTNPKK